MKCLEALFKTLVDLFFNKNSLKDKEVIKQRQRFKRAVRIVRKINKK